jgi:hypothetical protein
MAAHPNPDPVSSEDLVIQVAPQTIILGRAASAGNVWVTIHAEIPYSSVTGQSAWMETIDGLERIEGDIPVQFTFPDNRGELVVKFLYDDVLTLLDGVQEVEVKVVLAVESTEGTATGSDIVRILDKR